MKRLEPERGIKLLPCVAAYRERHSNLRSIYGEVGLKLRIEGNRMTVIDSRSMAGNLDDAFAACARIAWRWTRTPFHTREPDQPAFWIRIQLRVNEVPRTFPPLPQSWR